MFWAGFIKGASAVAKAAKVGMEVKSTVDSVKGGVSKGGNPIALAGVLSPKYAAGLKAPASSPAKPVPTYQDWWKV